MARAEKLQALSGELTLPHCCSNRLACESRGHQFQEFTVLGVSGIMEFPACRPPSVNIGQFVVKFLENALGIEFVTDRDAVSLFRKRARQIRELLGIQSDFISYKDEPWRPLPIAVDGGHYACRYVCLRDVARMAPRWPVVRCHGCRTVLRPGKAIQVFRCSRLVFVRRGRNHWQNDAFCYFRGSYEIGCSVGGRKYYPGRTIAHFDTKKIDGMFCSPECHLSHVREKLREANRRSHHEWAVEINEGRKRKWINEARRTLIQCREILSKRRFS
jgi:hypothetical protein